ncbi:Mitochondrial inner membrane protein Mitofilin [Macrophomina phaseolina MS6]|uniref:MICOS complex subunit MIC60 n=1 Tax=Macrophomina phaseolina (strain MS6) TaxID=1126212 RepID=K2RZ85_MACPH|nr:Mitochondrial inner membrane protein Mitofilin [Macrophomina phaseolina MS6]
MAFGQRYFADGKKSDETVLPGSQSEKAADEIPPPPTASPANPTPSGTIPPSEIPLTPPTPGQVNAEPPATGSAPVSGTGVPTGTGSASVAPPAGSPVPPPKKKGGFRRFLLTLLTLTTLGYAGGVYYSLVSDNFHDFFTEYVPFGEDAVGYVEEREFRKRFPGGAGQSRLHQQIRGENKVTIPSKSGLSWKVTDEEDSRSGSDLSKSGRHTSAVEESKQAAEEKKKKPAPAAANEKHSKSESTPAPAVAPIDRINLDGATEPVVQDVVKIINDIITVINADQAGSKYDSAIAKAKGELGKVINDIQTMKAVAEKQTEDKIRNLHIEFDNGAKELVSRIEAEMQDQEARWKDEFEAEREKLSQTYQSKLRAELDATQKVYEQKLKNELLEQAIALNRQFANSVHERVEQERQGRLAMLNELSDAVAELEKLTAEWNSVIDSNLRTQHMLVAVEAARNAVEKADQPRPFVEELAALKEIAADDPVVNAAIASINPAAYQKGVPTPSQLIDRFRRVAAEVRKAALLPEDAGVASHAASLVLSKVMFKKGGDGQGLPVGNDVESVLTRTEMLLEEGNIDAAAREMNGLSGWAKVLARDWLSDARRVLEVRQALDVLSTEARLQSLLVD